MFEPPYIQFQYNAIHIMNYEYVNMRVERKKNQNEMNFININGESVFSADSPVTTETSQSWFID